VNRTAVALLVVAVAAATGAEPLTLTNVRTTYGILGPTRTDDKVLPGDSVFVAFDIDGVTVDPTGLVKYSMGVDVSDASGRSLFKKLPADVEVPVSLGGSRVAAYAKLDVGLESPAGAYTIKVAVVDRATGRKADLKRTVQVQPRDFGLVRAALSHDQDGQLPAHSLGEGESVWLHFGAVGFQRRQDNNQPNLQFELKLLDDNGKPVQATPITAVVDSGTPEKNMLLPLRFQLALNRPGKFTAEVTATDRLSRQTTKLKVPLVVVGAP
jgi:hypothetical protein